MKVTEEQIAEKLKQVEEFEAKYGKNITTQAWRKWCTDPQYRKREQDMRNAVADYIYAKGIPSYE